MTREEGLHSIIIQQRNLSDIYCQHFCHFAGILLARLKLIGCGSLKNADVLRGSSSQIQR